jgi:hypothetical protein
MMSTDTPAILISIWSAVMPLVGARDAEVHVAVVVFAAHDVGEMPTFQPSPCSEAHGDATAPAP